MKTTSAGTVQLYRVSATRTVEFFVAARTHVEAQRYAEDNASEATWDADTYVDSVYEVDYPLSAWEQEEIPYGENEDNLTAKELLERTAEVDPEPDESFGPVAWCAACLHERVQFDWREEHQLCAECKEVTS